MHIGFVLNRRARATRKQALPEQIRDGGAGSLVEISDHGAGTASSGALPPQGLSVNVLACVRSTSSISCKMPANSSGSAPNVADDGSEDWDTGSIAYGVGVP